MSTLLPAVEVVFDWQDETLSHANTVAHRNSSETIAAVDAAAIALAGQLVAVSSAAIAGFTATWSFWVSDERPTTGIAASYGAILIFATTTTDEYMLFELPAVPLSYIEPGGMIDITNPDIADIASIIIGLEFCNPFGSFAVELLAALPTFSP